MNSLPDDSPHARGFTLIELLVVIAIMGLLAAIILPTTNAVLERGKSTQCMSNMRQWGQALMIALNQSPTQQFPTEGTAGATVLFDEATAWFNVLPPLMDLPSLKTLRDTGKKMPRPRDGTAWICPSIPPKAAASFAANVPFFSFGYNLWIDETARTTRLRNAGLLAPGETAPFPVVLRLPNIEHPARFVVFGEIEDARYATLNLAFMAYRHGSRKQVHLVFADGSARAYRKRDVGLTNSMANYLTLNPGGVIWCPGGKDITL